MRLSRFVDLATRKWWRMVGRPIDLTGAEGWLRGPMNSSAAVGDRWLAAEAEFHGGTVDAAAESGGLLPSMTVLDGPGFESGRLRPEIRDFYENTSTWDMDVWAGWSPLFWPVGELISRWFGQRVEQLALPMRPLDVAGGMDSRVDVIRDGTGRQVGAAWLRTLRASGRVVFSGCYSTRMLPGALGPSVHASFPLESGNLQVFLTPSVEPDGSLRLESPPGRFGQDGTYVVVRDGGCDHAARVPLHETFRVHVDDRGVLRTDHALRLRSTTALRLHYKIERAT